jgi:hypothetical protein
MVAGYLKDLSYQFNYPSINIFDPSLINSHYGINDRQPTNPPTDNSIDLMTPFLQAMISNKKQNQQQIATPQPQPNHHNNNNQ